MKYRHAPKILLCLGLSLIGASLAGCSHQGTDSSMAPTEEKSFKGGPPPPEALKAMQQGGKPGGAPAGTPPAAGTH